MKMSTIYYVTYTSLGLFIFTIMGSLSVISSANTPVKLIKGYIATPNPTVLTFQPLLTDSTGNFSLSFLRVNQDQLALAIVHVPSGESLWQANSPELAQWGKHTQLFFNGSLVITDSKSGVFWSTNTNGDLVVLTNSGTNLKILQGQNGNSVLWQSFDFPYNNLMENQNFASNMSLISSNGLYTMHLGFDFIGLYAKFSPSDSDSSLGLGLGQIYYKHGALQAKAQIVPGHGPITVRISSDGFMGMYQNGSVPADVETFNSYQRSVPGPRRVRIEQDGNLKGYYWSGSSWVIDYVAIPEPCELPNPCGPYGLCTPGEGCSCLNNETQTRSGECHLTQKGSSDLCGTTTKANKYSELRRTGVELPFKELMVYTKAASYEECEQSCRLNCTCWGALYNDASGFCYDVDYPIQTIMGMGDVTKMGYFKVSESVGKKRDKILVIGIGLLSGGILVFLSVVCLTCYKLSNRNRNIKNRFLEEEDIVSPGSYKDLGSSSFGSIELSNHK